MQGEAAVSNERRSMVDFEKYQLKEFELIAEAHFKTADAISSFFRYYLIVMSLPATAAAFFLSTHRDLETAILPTISSGGEFVLGCVMVLAAAVGYFLMLYLSNLRMDGLLYARTVNAIRKYFYDNSDLPTVTQQQMRVLPQTRHVPPYYEGRYFSPVILTFAFLDTAYFAAGSVLVGYPAIDNFVRLGRPFPWSIPIASILFFALHFLSYWSTARHREYRYLRRAAIGIDIDGVLNTHREQFCEVLYGKTGRRINAEEITVIPVRDNPALNVTQCEEYSVFHDVTYWTDMPAAEGAARALKELRNALNFRICIFSYRPWPIPTPGCPDGSRFDKRQWSCEVHRYRREHPIESVNTESTDPERPLGLPRNPIDALRTWIRNTGLDRVRAIYVWLPWVHLIDKITHLWLYRQRMQYDRLVIEKGHTNLASQNARFANRFNMATRYGVRFFIEDDLEKAIKMAYICDTVFLLDHPYNNDSVYIFRNFGKLPSNVIRVNTWDEIRRSIRRMA
jgi:uncharacterized HAD superfamily protein